MSLLLKLNENDLGVVFNQGSPWLITGLLFPVDGDSANQMWQARSQQLTLVLAEALCDLRDKKAISGLSAKVFNEHLSLESVFDLSNNESVGERIRHRLREYLEFLPRGSARSLEDVRKDGRFPGVLREQHGFVAMFLSGALQHYLRIEEAAAGIAL